MVKTALEALIHFEFCYELPVGANFVYNTQGFMFPSLRPWNGEFSIVTGNNFHNVIMERKATKYHCT